jgi:integrase
VVKLSSRVSSKRPSEAPKAAISLKSTSRRGYVAKRDYGTRGAERDRQIIRFGRIKATIYRRNDIEHGSWFLRVYLREEKRHYRKSLQTHDQREAVTLAEQEIVNILAKVQTGQRILAVSLADLVRQYRIQLESQVTSGGLAKNTMRLNNYRIAHGCKFLESVYEAGMATKVSAIAGSAFQGYLQWRIDARAAKSKGATIRRDVVRDELLSIRKMFLFAKKERLCTEKSVPEWDFVIEKQAPSRRRMTQRNYTAVVNVMRVWVSRAKNEKEAYQRRMLQHIFLLISNSGMRSGEVFGLRNRDVEVRTKANECVLTIRPETSKVRKGRRITVIGSAGGRAAPTKKLNYLIRWIEKHQRHKEPNGFAFSAFDKGSVSARDTYYHAYKSLRVELKKIDLGWFDTYHCRHFWITNRLLAEESIHLVAQAAGTSTREIEKTYSHVLTEMSTRKFGKRQVVYKPDESWVLSNTMTSDHRDMKTHSDS